MVTIEELIGRYERRRRRAEEIESRVSEARLLEDVLGDLHDVGDLKTAPRWLTTTEAAKRLRLAPKTVADWCRRSRDPDDNFDRFSNARKTSEKGEWRIPASDLEAARDSDEPRDDGANDVPSFID